AAATIVATPSPAAAANQGSPSAPSRAIRPLSEWLLGPATSEIRSAARNVPSHQNATESAGANRNPIPAAAANVASAVPAARHRRVAARYTTNSSGVSFTE